MKAKTKKRLKKALKTILCVLLVLVGLAGAGLGAGAVLLAVRGVVLTVDTEQRYQTIDGFGASAAWTAQSLGLEDDESIHQAAKKLYGKDELGLTIFRYNIGAGSSEEQFDDIVPYSNGWFDSERRAESFFVADRYSSPASFADAANYDFTRDAAAQKFLYACLEEGELERIVLFSNSPHYLMTVSGKTTGEVIDQTNLREDCYEAFCDYLFIIAKHFRDTLAEKGYTPEIVISPLNEPQWKWGGPDASQEGCHMDPEALAAFMDVFLTKLEQFNKENGLELKGDFLESGNYVLPFEKKKISDYLSLMDDYESFKALTSISVHDYKTNDSKLLRYIFKAYMQLKYPDLAIVPTELCELEAGRFDTMESGLFLGKVVSRDFTILDAPEWSWWLAVSRGDYNDGLVYWDKTQDGGNVFSVLKRYYVLRHFTNYLDTGDVRVGLKNTDILNLANIDFSAYEKPDGTLVYILINNGKERELTLDGVGQAIAVTTDESANLREYSITDGKITLPSMSITTVVVEK
ncbi:MAG: hypothetical protein LBQ80_01645 [Clostridium sp.]|jgi:O-glycosyl hydrolase|nr:hypothetical protein [Clostridium sp.]